jgi:hypothetical protein
MKKLITICLLVLVIAAGVRAEALSTSDAQINWTSLAITGGITWSNESSYSYAYAADDTGWAEDYRQEPGWVDTYAYAWIGDSWGYASTDDSYLYERVYAIANEATTTWADAEADAYRYGNFTADSDGWVQFSADYALWQELSTGDVGEWAYGYAGAGSYLQNYSTYEWDQDMRSLENSVSDGGSLTDGDAGTLTVAVWFNAGDSGYFQAGVYNGAEVQIPEPATLSLLSLGAVSLIRRKKRV